MADRVKFVGDNAGIKKWLQDNTADLIEDHAEAIAADLRDTYDVDADVQMTVTDRPRATVMVHGPKGQLIQARDGAFTKAAAKRGLEVSGGDA